MVLIAVLAVLCIFALAGMRKGVIRIAVSLAAMVITIAVTTVASPVLSEYIRNNTTWDDKIEKSIYENVSRDGKNYGNDDNELIESGITTYIDNIEEKVGAISERMNLPESLTKSISAAAVSGLDKRYCLKNICRTDDTYYSECCQLLYSIHSIIRHT